MKSKLSRDSNYELLRTLSMFFIVIWHIIQHGQLLEHTTGFSNMIFNMIMFFIIIHVNCFMLITGYYQSKSRFNLNRFISYILQIWFYNFTITSVLSLCGIIQINYSDYLINTSFFNIKTYWYINCFLIIYLLSPFLNSFIDKITKKELKKLIILMIFCFSVIPFFSGNLFYEETGYTITQHLLMYFIGAYIRKYNFDISILKNYNSIQKKITYILIFIVFWLINVMLYYFQQYLGQIDGDLCNYIAGKIGMYKYFYNSPIVIIQSVAIFLLFGKFELKSKIINTISSTTLGIYLIHENIYIKNNLYKWIGVYTGKTIYGNSIIVKVIMYAIIIFTGCAIIELVRKILFHMISKLKISKKANEKFQSIIKKICEIH